MRWKRQKFDDIIDAVHADDDDDAAVHEDDDDDDIIDAVHEDDDDDAAEDGARVPSSSRRYDGTRPPFSSLPSTTTTTSTSSTPSSAKFSLLYLLYLHAPLPLLVHQHLFHSSTSKLPSPTLH